MLSVSFNNKITFPIYFDILYLLLLFSLYLTPGLDFWKTEKLISTITYLNPQKCYLNSKFFIQ